MLCDKRNQNSKLFFKQTHEISGCFQFGVFNPKLELSTAIKCDPVFRMRVNDHFLFIFGTTETDSGTQGLSSQSEPSV
jgi:hypothetical protein